MALIFQDTFTDANGTRVNGTSPSHVPNLGATAEYSGNTTNPSLGASALVQANRVRCAIGPYAGNPFSDFHTLAVVVTTAGLAAARDVRADIFPVATVQNSIVEILFQYQDNISVPSLSAEYYAIHLRRTANPGEWAVYASYGPYQFGIVPSPYIFGAPRFSAQLGLVTIADGGAGLRLGATRYQSTRRYDFWHEPAGGGARTFLGSFTFPNYADTTHKGVGIGFTGPGASTSTADIDNLEVDDTGSGSTPAPPTSPSKSTERLLKYRSLGAAGFAHLGDFGFSASNGPGGGGSFVESTGYRAELGYSCIRTQVTGNGNPGGANGFICNRFGGTQINPTQMFTPNPTVQRIWRFRDVITVRGIQANGPGTVSYVFWGIFRELAASTVTKRCCVGFQTVFAGTAPGSWAAFITDASLVVRFNQDLGISPLSPHQLRLDLNGPEGTIDFYVDGVRIARYTVVGGELGGLPGSAIENFGLGANAGFAGGVATIIEAYHSAYGAYGGLITDEVSV